jgi:hypothetical protein
MNTTYEYKSLVYVGSPRKAGEGQWEDWLNENCTEWEIIDIASTRNSSWERVLTMRREVVAEAVEESEAAGVTAKRKRAAKQS